MTDKIGFEKLNIKLPKVSDKSIPPENYKIPFHNTHSRLNPENNRCDFNNYSQSATAVVRNNIEDTEDNDEQDTSFQKPKRLRTEENFNEPQVHIRRHHTDLSDKPYSTTALESTETFQVQFTEEQLEVFRKNRAASSYLSTESSSSATFTSSSTQEYSSSHSEKLFHNSSSSSLEGSQQDTSDNSTFILPRRQSLDNLSVASSIASPELDSGNSNNYSAGDKNDEEEIEFSSTEVSFSISNTTTTSTIRTNTLDQQVLQVIEEEEKETEDLSIV